MSMSKWKWFGNAGHLIVGQSCRFHLCTQVGGYLVSTVGQYWPERASREIHARIRDREWFLNNRALQGDSFDHAYMARFGYQEIGLDRTFETMVFRAGDACSIEGCACGMPEISGEELDFCGFSKAADATLGHMDMCKKWSSK